MSDTWVIYWRHPEYNTWDLDEYDSQSVAEEVLAEFQQKYPYNTYHMAKVERVVEATEKWKPAITYSTTSNGPLHITVRDGGGGRGGV